MSQIKTWRERVPVGYESCDKYEAMQAEIDELRSLLIELNLQYISDFGQLQEREPVGTVASLFDEAVINHCGFNRDHLVYLSPKQKE